ncbi:MAG: ATP-binding protein [Gammaproteobacteria bacterium]|nr:ATP-binding protein [Gammaproteobacteria bacterium]
MDKHKLVKALTHPIPITLIGTSLLFALCALIVRSFSDDSLGEVQFWVTSLGISGIVILSLFLAINLFSLLRQFVRGEMGSRLATKLVVIVLFLTLIPFSLLYYFSIQFLNKGVDGWFDVRIEQTVQDSLLLSQSALEGLKEEITADVQNYANNLREALPAGGVLRTLDNIREVEGYSELSLYADDGRVIAFSRENAANILPSTPSEEAFNQLRLNQTYTELETLTKDIQQFRVVAPITLNEVGRQFYGLQAIKILPLRYATLANSVESANKQYKQMVFARGPLKFSLMVTLSLISLVSLLFSILTAVYVSRRLVAPISNLAAGTQNIAEGNYGAQLPITTRDELGILTGSFNNMSQKIQEAQQTALASQAETEQQKGHLEAVLTNLSSGVFSFSGDRNLEMANSAAAEILGMNLSDAIGLSIDSLAKNKDHSGRFFEVVNNGISSNRDHWQDEINLLGHHGRQMLIVRGNLLKQASANGNSKTYLVVFDDVTNLIQAQRDAAWGEVARRLAHEIKNPLTPIQLSAERIKNKLSCQVRDENLEMLERSTRTIVHQVESMKEMVNAFSSYAQPVRAKLAPLHLNQLIRDVVELHASSFTTVDLKLDLDEDLPEIKANASALRQVLNNLIINALHAIDGNETEDPKIIMTTSTAAQVTGQYIDLVIQDNGPGIPEEIRESLFDPYVSSKAKGSGLGLAIVKRIVEEHSGSVWARNSKLGGAAMHLRLPINALQTYRGNRSQNAVKSEIVS